MRTARYDGKLQATVLFFFCVKYILKVGRNCRMSIISVHEILLTDGQTDGQRSFSNSARFVDTEP